MLISRKGHHFWKTCEDAMKNNTILMYGLVGKPSNGANEFNLLVKAGLHAFFENLKTYLEPVATQFVHSKVNEVQTLCNADTETTSLSPHLSK